MWLASYIYSPLAHSYKWQCIVMSLNDLLKAGLSWTRDIAFTSPTGSKTIIWTVIGMIARIYPSCITLQLYACQPDSTMYIYRYIYTVICLDDLCWHDSHRKYMFQDFWLSTECIIVLAHIYTLSSRYCTRCQGNRKYIKKKYKNI